MFLKTAVLALTGLGLALFFAPQSAHAGVIYEYSPSITLNLDVCSNGGDGLCTPGGADPLLQDLVLVQDTSIIYGGVLAGPVDGETAQAVGCFDVGCGFTANSDGSVTLTVGPYDIPGAISAPPTFMLGIGWINYLPSDGSSAVDHVVLFVNSGSIPAGSDWDTLFPDFTESQILQDLKNSESSDETTADTATGELFIFGVVDVAANHPGFVPAPTGAALDAVAFSTSTNIGSGITNSELDQIAPEPSSWLMLLLPAVCLAFVKLRRRSATRSC